MPKHLKHLRSVTERLNPKYNFDPKESIYSLAVRMSDEDWLELKHAIKYPNGKLRLVAENELLLQQQWHQANEDDSQS